MYQGVEISRASQINLEDAWNNEDYSSCYTVTCQVRLRITEPAVTWYSDILECLGRDTKVPEAAYRDVKLLEKLPTEATYLAEVTMYTKRALKQINSRVEVSIDDSERLMKDYDSLANGENKFLYGFFIWAGDDLGFKFGQDNIMDKLAINGCMLRKDVTSIEIDPALSEADGKKLYPFALAVTKNQLPEMFANDRAKISPIDEMD